MQANYRSHSFRRKSGFTLIELMVVIMIISILSGVVLSAMNSSDDSRALDSGITRLDSLFSLARSAAITRKQKTRVLISLDNSNFASPDQPQRFLRYATIVYFDDDADQWKVYSEGEYLPAGVYFSPGLSTLSSDAEPLAFWALTINLSTMQVQSSPAYSSLSPSYTGNISGLSETISSAGANNWLAYEFNTNGTFSNPGARVVLVPGVHETVNTLKIPLGDAEEVTDLAKGFVVFRSGKALHIQSGDQIK